MLTTLSHPPPSPLHSKFYTLEALRPYKWYWRLEPDVDFACSITYDPFAEMAARGHAYGWTISLWEEPDTCPTLFRAVSDWREARRLPGNDLWRAMAQASWLPAPLRGWLGGWRAQHDRRGDAWSLCHYWSNFEIADLDFFRGREYQELFEYLDRKGGFYSERVCISVLSFSLSFPRLLVWDEALGDIYIKPLSSKLE